MPILMVPPVIFFVLWLKHLNMMYLCMGISFLAISSSFYNLPYFDEKFQTIEQ